eukprot:jgi/Mesvir1/14722/Mv05370-RA.1
MASPEHVLEDQSEELPMERADSPLGSGIGRASFTTGLATHISSHRGGAATTDTSSVMGSQNLSLGTQGKEGLDSRQVSLAIHGEPSFREPTPRPSEEGPAKDTPLGGPWQAPPQID